MRLVLALDDGGQMFGIFETLFGRLGGSAVTAGVGALVHKFRPTRISGQKAPRNFFEYFGPGVSKDFVKSKIGAPHRQVEGMWSYQFTDALAHFDFSEGDSASSVALALVNSSPAAGFELPMLGVPLGKLNFDFFSPDDEGRFVYRSTLRTWELLYHVKFPPHWASNYYTFGALSLLAPFGIRESLFDTKIAEATPDTAAKGVMVNWVGISSSSDEMWFDWSIAVPASA